MNKNKKIVLPAVRSWYKVDNAANMYSIARSKNFSRTYRNSVVLSEDIDIETMQRALEKTAKRFPTMNTVLRTGAFWSYLEHTDRVPKIEEEMCIPARYILHNGEDSLCYRVNVYKNRLSIDMFHGLADGAGALAFLKTLVVTYYELKGIHPASYCGVANTADEPSAAEVEDSSPEYAVPVKKAVKPKLPPVYIGENDQIEDFVRFVYGRFPVSTVKAVAKRYLLTITEYLAAAMIMMYIHCSDEPINLPIKISIPVDLRRRFPSETVRNFVFMTEAVFNPHGKKDISFDAVADAIRGRAALGASPEALQKALSINVAAEQNIVTSAVPFPIKQLVMRKSYEDMQYSYTTILSNLGEVKFPPEVQSHVLEADCCLCKTPFLHFGCAAVSFNGMMNLTFTSANRNTEREKYFFRLLASHGIPVRIDSSI